MIWDDIHTHIYYRLGVRWPSRWRCFRFLFLLFHTTKLHLSPILVLLAHCAHCTNQRVIYTHSWSIAVHQHPFIWYSIIPTHLYTLPKRFHQARITPWRRTTPVIPKVGPTQLHSPRTSMWLVCTLEWVARLAKGASELSMKVPFLSRYSKRESEIETVCVNVYVSPIQFSLVSWNMNRHQPLEQSTSCYQIRAS